MAFKTTDFRYGVECKSVFKTLMKSVFGLEVKIYIEDANIKSYSTPGHPKKHERYAIYSVNNLFLLFAVFNKILFGYEFAATVSCTLMKIL